MSKLNHPVLEAALREYPQSRLVDISHEVPQIRQWIRETSRNCAHAALWTGNAKVVMAVYRRQIVRMTKP